MRYKIFGQPNAAELAETEDIQLTPAIQAKAQELGNNPVKIHNWAAKADQLKRVV